MLTHGAKGVPLIAGPLSGVIIDMLSDREHLNFQSGVEDEEGDGTFLFKSGVDSTSISQVSKTKTWNFQKHSLSLKPWGTLNRSEKEPLKRGEHVVIGDRVGVGFSFPKGDFYIWQ